MASAFWSGFFDGFTGGGIFTRAVNPMIPSAVVAQEALPSSGENGKRVSFGEEKYLIISDQLRRNLGDQGMREVNDVIRKHQGVVHGTS